MQNEEILDYLMNPGVFCFCPQFTDSCPQIMKRNHHDRRIQLFPLGRSCFEFISLFDLCQFLQGYRSPKIEKNTKHSIYYFEIYNLAHSSEITKMSPEHFGWSFFVIIKLPSFEVQVFARYFLLDFQFTQINETYVMKLKRRSETRESKHQHDTPFQILAAFCADKHHKCPKTIRNFFPLYFGKKSLNLCHTEKSKEVAIENILRTCPGHVLADFYVQKFEDGSQRKAIKTISIVFPWAANYFREMHFLELDASFKAIEPLTFCVAQAIIFNESIPLSITITQSESSLLYDTTFNRFDQIFKQKIDWRKIRVLSDLGAAIHSACKSRGIKQFYCHRHLIERFGAAGALGIFAAKILKCHSYGECSIVITEILYQVYEYVLKLTSIYNKIPDEINKKLPDLFIMMNLDKGDPNSMYFYEGWALWYRRDFNVPRCSNHNESLHRVLNSNINLTDNIPTKLDSLISGVVKHYQLLNGRVGKSIDRKINKHITHLIEKLKNPTFDLFAYIKEEPCKCEENIYNQKIYGANIPCRHNFFNNALRYFVELRELLHINRCTIPFNEFIISILSNTRSNTSLIQNKFNFPLDSETFSHLKSCINNLLSSLHPPKPQIRFIPIDWECQSYIQQFSPIQKQEQNKKEEASVNHWSFLKYSSDSEKRIDPDLDPHLKDGMKIVYETIEEIHHMYPRLTYETVYSICFNRLLARQNEMKTQDRLVWISKFKIDCYGNADKTAQKNLFFLNAP